MFHMKEKSVIRTLYLVADEFKNYNFLKSPAGPNNLVLKSSVYGLHAYYCNFQIKPGHCYRLETNDPSLVEFAVYTEEYYRSNQNLFAKAHTVFQVEVYQHKLFTTSQNGRFKTYEIRVIRQLPVNDGNSKCSSDSSEKEKQIELQKPFTPIIKKSCKQPPSFFSNSGFLKVYNSQLENLYYPNDLDYLQIKSGYLYEIPGELSKTDGSFEIFPKIPEELISESLSCGMSPGFYRVFFNPDEQCTKFSKRKNIPKIITTKIWVGEKITWKNFADLDPYYAVVLNENGYPFFVKTRENRWVVFHAKNGGCFFEQFNTRHNKVIDRHFCIRDETGVFSEPSINNKIYESYLAETNYQVLSSYGEGLKGIFIQRDSRGNPITFLVDIPGKNNMLVVNLVMTPNSKKTYH